MNTIRRIQPWEPKKENASRKRDQLTGINATERLCQISTHTINSLDSGIRLITSPNFQCYCQLFLNLLICVYFCGKSRNSTVEAVLQLTFKTEVYTSLGVLFCFMYSCNPSFLVKDHLVPNNSIPFKLG